MPNIKVKRKPCCNNCRDPSQRFHSHLGEQGVCGSPPPRGLCSVAHGEEQRCMAMPLAAPIPRRPPCFNHQTDTWHGGPPPCSRSGWSVPRVYQLLSPPERQLSSESRNFSSPCCESIKITNLMGQTLLAPASQRRKWVSPGFPCLSTSPEEWESVTLNINNSFKFF